VAVGIIARSELAIDNCCIAAPIAPNLPAEVGIVINVRAQDETARFYLLEQCITNLIEGIFQFSYEERRHKPLVYRAARLLPPFFRATVPIGSGHGTTRT